MGSGFQGQAGQVCVAEYFESGFPVLFF